MLFRVTYLYLIALPQPTASKKKKKEAWGECDTICITEDEFVKQLEEKEQDKK